MIIVEKNEGPKIPFEVTGKKICFDDDLTINLAKREQDDAVHIDICYDADRELVIGAAAGRAYVAEIDIPARRYEEVENPDYDPDDPQSQQYIIQPVPMDMDTVTLTLWAIE